MDKLSWKKSALVKSEILRLFFNTLTASISIPVAIWWISSNNVKRSYLRNQKIFLDFLLRFWNVYHIWYIFLKKVELSSLSITKLLTGKEEDTHMSKRPYFRTRFGKQRVSGLETLLKSARNQYYRIFSWIWEKLSWKRSFLIRSGILGLFLNMLTAE